MNFPYIEFNWGGGLSSIQVNKVFFVEVNNPNRNNLILKYNMQLLERHPPMAFLKPMSHHQLIQSIMAQVNVNAACVEEALDCKNSIFRKKDWGKVGGPD